MFSTDRRFSRPVRFFIMGLIALWVAAPVAAKAEALSTPTPGPSSPASEDYPKMVIGPGDVLSITVLGYERSLASAVGGASLVNTNPLPVTYLVDTDGKITFPYLGEVSLLGLSQSEASRLLGKKLDDYLKYPEVTVLIQASNTFNVSLLGDLLRPGQFMIHGKPDILSMLAQAGGPGPNPDLGGVLLTRGTQKIRLDLGKYLNDPNFHEPAPTVYPGDVIYVPQNPWPTLGEIAVFLGIVYTAYTVANDLKK